MNKKDQQQLAEAYQQIYKEGLYDKLKKTGEVVGNLVKDPTSIVDYAAKGIDKLRSNSGKKADSFNKLVENFKDFTPPAAFTNNKYTKGNLLLFLAKKEGSITISVSNLYNDIKSTNQPNEVLSKAQAKELFKKFLDEKASGSYVNRTNQTYKDINTYLDATLGFT